MKLKKFFQKNLAVFIAAIIGAVAGYLYYRFVGCVSGACAITSNPVISTLYGGVIGGLLGSVFTPGTCGACAGEKAEAGYDE